MWIVIAATVVIAAVVVTLVLTLGGGAETFAVKGSLTLSGIGSPSIGDESADFVLVAGTCYGANGYDDVDSGAQVVVKDSSGKTVAAGRLRSGTADGFTECKFNFEIKAVPTGQKFYSVSLGRRGEQEYSEKELRDGPMLTLGS